MSEELRLNMALTTPLIAIKGYTAVEVEEACTRARDLSQRIGDTPYLFTVLEGLCSIYLNRGEFSISIELANQMLSLAESKHDRDMLLWAHYSLGLNMGNLGDFSSARDHMEQSLALYDFERQRSYGFVQDPGATALATLAEILYTLGYPEQALERLHQGLAWARKLSHLYSLASVLLSAGIVYWNLGEYQASQESCNEAVTLATMQGFQFLLVAVTSRAGLALVKLGKQDEGIAQICEMLPLVSITGLSTQRLHVLAMLAEAYLCGRSTR